MTEREPPHGERSRTIEIPEPLARAVARRLGGTEFETVDEYVVVAVEQVLREVERTDSEDRTGDDEETDGPGEAIADRLESLGYL